MGSYDRDELLGRVDLAGLFTGLVGPARGRGRSAMWPCPSPGHAQTGKTPPVSLDPAKGLWRCHGCGAGGTAIDLVVIVEGVGVREAIETLAQQVGLESTDQADDSRPPPRRKPQVGSRTVPATIPSPAAGSPPAGVLDAYVSACEVWLWSPEGTSTLAWLRARGFADEVLRSARVGADPGEGDLAREAGLPRRGGVVFPVLDAGGRAVYCQVRVLAAGGDRKYDNPQERVFGANPRVAVIPTPAGGHGEDLVVVCEGVPDALTAATAGYRAVAVLGAGYPDRVVAERLVQLFPGERLVLAFDGDEAGERGATALADHLVGVGAGPRVYRLTVPPGVSADPKERDLNTWALAAGMAFAAELAAGVAGAVPAGWTPAASAADRLAGFFATQADQAGALAIPTGIGALDELLARGGWRPGVVLLGGLPGIGKTAFALHATMAAAHAGHPVVYLSVEQGPDELLGRIFCRETGRSIADYWNRDPDYLTGARQAAARLPLERLYLSSDPYLTVDVEGTVGRLRRLVAQVAGQTGATPLVVVDYLQRMRPPDADRRLDDHRQVSLAGLGLRQLARDLACPIVAISSVNRQGYDKAPSLDAFKGSGDLEYDADACLLLRLAARSEEEARLLARSGGVVPAELYMVKNRYGPLNLDQPVQLGFDRGYGGFRETNGSTTTTGMNSHGAPPNPPNLLRPGP